MRTSDDYRPCVVLFPHGAARRANILHTRLDTLDQARAKLRRDLAAWVSPQDYEILKLELNPPPRDAHA
jgi:hypothetical protein